MNYKFEYIDDILVVKVLSRRATVEISGHFKNDLNSKITEEHNRIVVDLSKTDFVDSTFLGVLVAGLKKATIHNGDLKVGGLQESVRGVFQITRLYKIFDIFDDSNEAVQSFSK